ncbi:MAG TPA: alpha-amylase family glycosyl hydrolase [Bryobacteraceae bacterium]|nr:alpha-amylase family glycosyl hydrolase [Bryobacteraceae bacterium]
MRILFGFCLAAVLVSPCNSQGLSVGSLPARGEPAWMSKVTIYQIWLNAFSKEGTLRGAIPGLKRVADLGAPVVYLGPIAKRSARPHASPYNIADYNAVDPQYGTEADLHEFIRAAHQLGLKVMLDIVYYHTAPDGVMMEHPDWLIHTGDNQIARGFWPQPLPDFSKPQVREYLIGSMVHWVRDFGVDGFRCDVGAGVPVSFWEEARGALDKINRDVILLSESDRPDDQLHAFDINYNFQGFLTLRSVLRDGAPAIDIRKQWEQTKRDYPQGARLLRFDDNHDWRRAVLELGDRAAYAAAVLNFTLDGVPFLYNGQEIGDCTPTHWLTSAPIDWPHPSDRNDSKVPEETLAKFKRLFAIRNQYPALQSGDLTWINNTAPENVLSFIRTQGSERILVVLNMSNRNTHVTVDLPVMEYSSVDDLLTERKKYFQLYSGRVSMDLSAYEALVGKQIPLSPLPPAAH